MYIHELWDEPRAEKIGVLKSAAQIISQDYPGIRKLLTITPHSSLCQELIDCAPFLDEVIIYESIELPAYKDYIPAFKKAGCKLFIYKCGTYNGTDAYSYYRCFPWHILSEKLDGIALYTVTTGYYSGGHDWRVMGGSSGGNWLIRSFDNIIRTIRSDTLLAGFNDVKYMCLLKKLADKCKDKKLASEAVSFYNQAIKQVLMNDNNPEFINGIREKIIDFILKLQKSNSTSFSS